MYGNGSIFPSSLDTSDTFNFTDKLKVKVRLPALWRFLMGYSRHDVVVFANSVDCFSCLFFSAVILIFHHRFHSYRVWNQRGLSAAISRRLSPRATTPALIRRQSTACSSSGDALLAPPPFCMPRLLMHPFCRNLGNACFSYPPNHILVLPICALTSFLLAEICLL